MGNLVRNAMKYMGDRAIKRVVVRAKSGNDRVRIEVEDTGPGIPEELRTAIFEPFFRGPDTGVSGVGIGLATVKRLVESHGGGVGVYSSSTGGSVFWVDVPRAPDAMSRVSAPN